jgi:hypothetical protein
LGAALEDFMQDPDANLEAGLSLSCPACGETLSALDGSDDMLGCPAGHHYTLPTLLFAQAMRASALLEAGARLLDEQEHLVRAIAAQLWNSESLASFKLEGQADRLRETTDSLRHLITEGVLQSQPLRGVTGSDN